MSYLNKPYEISVWEDVWRNERFEEQKICVIGSNTMQSQTRVFSPELTRNTNGTKRLTFQMYKKFVDTVTGEETINPFYDYLVSERKVKLYYKGTWHDFLIKGITETSKDYLYSYSLEDAMVHELSRNGYDVIFDEQLVNNTGTALELGQKTMLGTDWTVESDLIVQTNEEALVWVQMPNDLSQGAVLQANRVNDADMSITPVDFATASHVLAFYSCCTGKPHRFQFIYLSDYTEEFVKKNSDRIIEMADCQYYKDYDPEDYETVSGTEFYLPKGWTLSGRINNSSDSMPVSHLYRGMRYGYNQEMIYHPGLDRYVSIWNQKGGSDTFYSYTKTEYNSPVFLTNYLVNSDLRSGSSGWYTIRSDEKVRSSEVVSGMFVGGAFKSVSDMTVENIISSDLNQFSTYLRIEQGQSFYNTGLTDNRKILKLEPDDRLIVTGEFYFENGNPVPLSWLNCSLEEAIINSSGKYALVSDPSNLTFTKSYSNDESCFIFSQNRGLVSDDDIAKNTCFKVKFNAPQYYLGTIYVRNVQLFKEKRDKYGNLLTPDDTETVIDDQDIILSKQVYFNPALQPDGMNTKEEDLILATSTSFVPKYRDKAEKARSISAKESNYFNILQTIAESFGVWLRINVEHNEDGTISNKKIKFSNYIGNDNYAGFRYGINLKEITRTQESKNIVTKLIVKNNNNKYAKNGFCTVARANSNDSGETALYNFQYYHACGLLKAEDYTNYMYNASGALGKDIDAAHTSTNAKNFFKRLKAINTKLAAWNEELAAIKLELTSLRADQYTTETIRDSARDEGATIARKFLANYKVTTIDQWPQVVEMTPDDDILRSDAAKNQYFEWLQVQKTMEEADEKLDAINRAIDNRLERQEGRNGLEVLINQYTEYKKAIQSAFYKQFNRFIQEGTWMSEEYTSDEKYYIDAQSTLYNSCYPKAQYSISVASLGGLDGYETYDFDIGDRTYVQDEEFFGSNDRISVVVTETTENLDDPTRASIKVQNFKNEFQDLFQKITATVQQTQYSTGAYYKAVELAEADPNTKLDFLGDAFNSDTAVLSIGGQSTVTQDASGISIIDKTDPYQALRLLGGKILISRRDEQGNRYWATGLSAGGLSADLITAGTINTSVLNIMNEDSPAFRWDVHGISAFSTNSDGTYDRNKFTRFDKFGFYGVADESINGEEWSPEDADEISEKASFYLTWDGLKAYKGEIGGFTIGKFYFNSYSEQAKEALYYGITPNVGTTYNDDTRMLICPGGTPGKLFDYDTEKLWSMLIGKSFGVTNGGEIYASEGKISDFSIGKFNFSGGAQRSSFYYGCEKGKPPNDQSFVICPSGVWWPIEDYGKADGKRWVILSGTNFGVTQKGILYATNAEISGKISASSGSIGAWNVGTVESKNELTWASGFTNSIWGTTVAQKGEEGYYTIIRTSSSPNNLAFSIKKETTSGSEDIFYVRNNGYLYAADAYLNGKLFSRVVDGSSYAESLISEGTVAAAAWSNGTEFTDNYSEGNRFVLNGETLSFYRKIRSSSQGVALRIMNWDTSGTSYIYRPAYNNENPMASIQFHNGLSSVSPAVWAHLQGSWSAEKCLDTDSDRRLKFNITDFTEEYDVLFDCLAPRKFSYVNLSEDGVHMGYIVDEVERAINIAELKQKLLACNSATEFKYGSLAYEEFIALNTWQIQKLKPRMTTAEQEILKLKNEIQSLRAEIENLKKS